MFHFILTVDLSCFCRFAEYLEEAIGELREATEQFHKELELMEMR